VLIGIAEVIPGVSGGTLALITGIYSRLLNNIDLLFKSLRQIAHPKLMARNLIALEWKFLLPVFIGMALALITTASFMEGLLESNPIELRAVFAGLVAAGIYIPFKMSVSVNGDNWTLRDYLLALLRSYCYLRPSITRDIRIVSPLNNRNVFSNYWRA
jgi:putative membrane protein